MEQKRYKELAKKIRAYSILMTYWSKSGHVGGSLSIADILAVLCERVLNVDPQKSKMA